ncbi:unnamed protein product, partial [Iphiclides podalirius]
MFFSRKGSMMGPRISLPLFPVFLLPPLFLLLLCPLIPPLPLAPFYPTNPWSIKYVGCVRQRWRYAWAQEKETADWLRR